jgi:hypothetical protein
MTAARGVVLCAGSALARLPGGAHERVRHVHLGGVAAALSAAWAALVLAELEQAAQGGRTTSFDGDHGYQAIRSTD